jgi:hypothetical protein
MNAPTLKGRRKQTEKCPCCTTAPFLTSALPSVLVKASLQEREGCGCIAMHLPILHCQQPYLPYYHWNPDLPSGCGFPGWHLMNTTWWGPATSRMHDQAAALALHTPGEGITYLWSS